MTLSILPELGRVENAGNRGKEEATPTKSSAQPQSTDSCAGEAGTKPFTPETTPDWRRAGSQQTCGGYPWATSSVSSGEVVEISGTDPRRCSAADINNDGDAYLAYVPVNACRYGSDAERRSQTPSGQPGAATQRLEDTTGQSAAGDRIDKRPAGEGWALNRKKESFTLQRERLLSANHPPLLQEVATIASAPSDTSKVMATNTNCAVVIKAPQAAMSKQDSVVSMATSSDDEDPGSPDIDMVALAERVGATPAQAHEKVSSALQNSHKTKHGSAGMGVAFAAEASEEAKKALKKQQWRRRTTASHLTIPTPEGGMQKNEGSVRLTQLQRSIKEGDAADAIGIRSSTTPEADPGGWKRRGSALAEKAVFQQGTLPTFDPTPPPPTPGRARTLSLFIPSDVKRLSEEQVRDEKQEEVFLQLQAQQKEIQRQLEQQAEQHRQQMQQQQDLLETILRQQRQLEEKEKHIEEQRQELEKRQRLGETDASASPHAKGIASSSATRHTLTGAQRQQLHEHLKQFEYLQQNRPRTSRSVPGLQEKDGKDEGGAAAEQKVPTETESGETRSGRGRSSVASKNTNQFSILDRVHRYLMEPSVLLLDVRSPQEFAAEKVAGSINVPSEQFLSCLHLLPRNKETPLVVYCSDGSRAKQAASALRKLGHVNVCDAVSIKIVKHSLDGAVVRKALMSARLCAASAGLTRNKTKGASFLIDAIGPQQTKNASHAEDADSLPSGDRSASLLAPRDDTAACPSLGDAQGRSSFVHPDIDDSLVDMLLLRVQQEKVSRGGHPYETQLFYRDKHKTKSPLSA
ncbi:putative rhodanese-like domain containing protein [Neospora caninum Liverpool]|uniref:Putative rhodanese-like domain containing protein n=1 Tax=Neospora caninum (strain Liverpool) TaxID=572307 RepID=F0V7G8_NEOCL|nr:putative rhodanese-like domain containing protein [Neospora caninum Liverpool]CBZ49659.1 putative rhodanese-like domain containing protein [Neospora caninum Liverpool]|eukprot:XP_003879694.1 putative rhodanese-like domain containing protein [Neospora caninum Liverpool]